MCARYFVYYIKTCVKWPLTKRPKIGFQVQLLLNAGQKYCRMLQGEHSAILSTFIKLPLVIKIFVMSIFEWPFDSGFTLVPDWNHISMDITLGAQGDFLPISRGRISAPFPIKNSHLFSQYHVSFSQIKKSKKFFFTFYFFFFFYFF